MTCSHHRKSNILCSSPPTLGLCIPASRHEESMSICAWWFFALCFLISYLLIFRESVRDGEREGEKHWLITSCTPSTRGPGLQLRQCPNWESNSQPFGLQNNAQPTEPHQSGLYSVVLKPSCLQWSSRVPCHPHPHSCSPLWVSWRISCTFGTLVWRFQYYWFPTTSQEVQFGGFWFVVLPWSGTTSFMGHTFFLSEL